MPSKEDAVLASIFGYDAPEGETEEKSEVETAEAEKPEEQKGEEGKGQPSAVAPAKEPTGEVATEPKTEIGEDEDSRDRYQKLLEELEGYRQYEPLIRLFKESPDLARQVLADRMGLTANEPVKEAPAKPVADPEREKKIREYWERRMQEDPLAGLAEFIQATVAEASKPTKVVGVKALVRDFKAERKADDPMFERYEGVFDELISQADPEQINTDPDTALNAIEAIALGMFVKQQREAKKRAEARQKAAPVQKEKPRSLGTGTVVQPSGGQPVAKPKRELSEEERYLQGLYGEDLISEEDEEEPESIWGRA